MRSLLGVLLALISPPAFPDVNHGEDNEIGNCLVRSHIDGFTEEITSILIVCRNDGEDPDELIYFRLDYYPVYDVADAFFFDYNLGVNGGEPNVVFRFDDKPARRLRDGTWSGVTLGLAQFALQDTANDLSDLLTEINNSIAIRYRIGVRIGNSEYNGDVKKVSFPDEVQKLVNDFIGRIKDAGLSIGR